ncbi:BLUF domain-containing protein [Roseomonas elaeocarpi]|uniref:BLUF domain-containing protein n=1 Tax=Roseomonas elaeocarpi TaxID=907779 RepID=A0ABV6JNV5_9PROT
MSETESLYRLIYVSRNALAGVATEMEGEVTRILEASRRNNGRDGVTGALLFNEECFAQLLEGGSAAVHQVFERIQLDPRHQDTVVLECGPASRREFGAWSMAYAGHVSSERARYAALTGEASGAGGPHGILSLLHGVVERSGLS